MRIGIIQPDSGNITSICDALTRVGCDYQLLPKPELDGIDRLILPGQGRFGAVMSYLRKHDWTRVLRNWIDKDRPLLAICVGMQVLFHASDEDPNIAGLGILAGKVERLKAPKLPMIGWADVDWTGEGYPPGAAYFVNSYAIKEHPLALAHSTHGERFCSAVGRGRLMACQFHPEKSGDWGKEFLSQCLAL